MTQLPRNQIIGAKLKHIGHSNYSEPEFVIEGIGPASFRSHFITLDSGIVLDLFTAEITIPVDPMIDMPGETEGIPVERLIGLTVTALRRDDVFSSLIILDHNIFLRDDNDGATGNSLLAGQLADYSSEELSEFVDYWTETPIQGSHKKNGA
ncbi:MAG: hypothetical protein ACR2NK_13195 [Mariniblastus sp.]